MKSVWRALAAGAFLYVAVLSPSFMMSVTAAESVEIPEEISAIEGTDAAETINGEIITISEPSGDAEGLYAIIISEEDQDNVEVAEVQQYASGELTPSIERYLGAGSDYAYNDMALRSNTEGRQGAYRDIGQACYAFMTGLSDGGITNVNGTDYDTAFTVNVFDYGLTAEEAYEVYFMFRNCNPQYFWLGNSVILSSMVGYVTKINIVTYTVYSDGDARFAALEEIVNNVETIYDAKISETDTPYEKVLKLHDTLIADISYSADTSVQIAHSLAGALTSAKSAVCEGYAKAIQLLMDLHGINNIFVDGYAGGPHAWNLVQMDDGLWYWMDATWDDVSVSAFTHRYFLVGNTNFTNHTPSTPDGTSTSFLYALPEASDSNYDPLNTPENADLTTTLSEAIGNASDGSELTFETSEATILKNSVLQALGEKAVTLNLILENGVQWQVKDVFNPNAGDINLSTEKKGLEEGPLDTEMITALMGARDVEQLDFEHQGNLGFEGQIILPAGSEDGMKGVLLMENNGSLQLVDSAIVEDGKLNFSIDWCADSVVVYAVNGDVNGDGRVAIQDLMRMLYHVSGKMIFNELDRGIADVNMDDGNLVNIQDLMSALYYVSGKNSTL